MSDQENELSIVDKVEKIKAEAKNQILERTIKSEENLDKLIEQYTGDEIVIDDKAKYDFYVKGGKEMKKINGLVEKNRKEITAPFTTFQKDMIAFVKPWQTKLDEAQAKISEKTVEFENKEKAAAEKLFSDRSQELAKNGYNVIGGNYIAGILVITPEQIRSFNDEEFNFHLEQGKKEKVRQEAEEKRKKEEADEIIKERAELDKMRADIAKERAELDKMRAEVKKDKEIVDESISKIEPEKLPVDENPTTNTEPEKVAAATETPVETPIEKLKENFDLDEKSQETKIEEGDQFTIGFEMCRSLILTDFTNLNITKKRSEWIQFFKDLKPC